jgi:hypothetical protein
MKVSPFFSKLLTNKYLLYFILFISVTNVLGYFFTSNFKAVIFFAIVAYLLTHFTNNMTIILLSTLVLTNILVLGTLFNNKEGMENNIDNAVLNNRKPNLKKESFSRGSTTTNNSSSDDINGTSVKDTSSNIIFPVPEDAFNTSDEAFEVGRKKSKLDYASTVENAYDNLNKILGGNGMKNLTNDTQNLVNQQMQLAEAMKGMTPLMDNAKKMLEGLDMKHINGLADLAKKFTSG